eukprot:439014-Heterocapsa_arctica.AAC.1
MGIEQTTHNHVDIDSQAQMLCKMISVLRGIKWRGCPKTVQTPLQTLNKPSKTFKAIDTCMCTPAGPTEICIPCPAGRLDGGPP